jgi:hypothetical protein
MQCLYSLLSCTLVVSIWYVPVLAHLSVCHVGCGESIVLKIQISHNVQRSNGDREVRGDRQ